MCIRAPRSNRRMQMLARSWTRRGLPMAKEEVCLLVTRLMSDLRRVTKLQPLS